MREHPGPRARKRPRAPSVGTQNGPGARRCHSRPSLGLTPCSTRCYPQCTGPPLSHTGTHTHPRSRREPGPSLRAPGCRPLRPRTYLEVAPAADPPWRLREAGARPGTAEASDSGQGSAGAEQRLRAGSGRRLHPRSAPGRRRRRRRGGPGGSGARSLRAARSEGAPAPALSLAAARHRRRRPATAPHTSIIHRPSPASRAKPITGGGSANGAAAAAAEEAASRAPGRKRQPSGDGDGPGARGGRGRKGRANETSHGPRPARRAGYLVREITHPLFGLVGLGARGRPGALRRGGGEGGGGAREEDERLADLPRRLQGALARARPPRPASLAVRTPAPQPAARTHSRAQTVGPATLLRGSASEYESEAAHISNLHAGVVLVHAAAERTHDPTSSALASGRGRRPGPLPSPVQAINWKQHLCEWVSRNAAARGGRREGAGGG